MRAPGFRHAVAAAFAATFALASPGVAQQPNPRPVISVSGSGEVELKPDFARLLTTVDTLGDTVAEATSANRTATERVLARLEALGVKRSDVQTINLQVYRVPKEPELPARHDTPEMQFAVNHHLKITTRDIDGVGRLTGEILAVEGMTFRSLTWGLDRSDSGRDEARRAAVRDAQRQAQVYAEAANVGLGRLVEIRDGTVQAFGAEEAAPAMRMTLAKDVSFPVVPPATVRYGANVQMVWEIESR